MSMLSSERLAILLAGIADELHQMRRDLDDLGDELCANPVVVVEHGKALQSLDRIGQQQMAIAAVLRADRPDRAIAGVPLERLRRRLTASLTRTSS